MKHQQDDPNFPQPTVEAAGPDAAAGFAGRPRRRWIPATAIVGGVLVTAALTGTSIANAADEGGTPTGPPSASASASASESPSESTSSASPTPGVTAQGTGGAASPSAPASGTDLPTPPAVGELPAPPAGGPGGAGVPAPGGPTADGSTRVLGVVNALDDSSITISTDTGDQVTATLTDATTYRPDPPIPGADPSSTTTTKPVVGQRVELRVKDGAVVDAGVVHAHADGTVLSTSGTSALLATREGLHVTLDLSATDATIAVGDQVHAEGSASSDGSAIVVSSLQTAG